MQRQERRKVMISPNFKEDIGKTGFYSISRMTGIYEYNTPISMPVDAIEFIKSQCKVTRRNVTQSVPSDDGSSRLESKEIVSRELRFKVTYMDEPTKG